MTAAVAFGGRRLGVGSASVADDGGGGGSTSGCGPRGRRAAAPLRPAEPGPASAEADGKDTRGETPRERHTSASPSKTRGPPRVLQAQQMLLDPQRCVLGQGVTNGE